MSWAWTSRDGKQPSAIAIGLTRQIGAGIAHVQTSRKGGHAEAVGQIRLLMQIRLCKTVIQHRPEWRRRGSTGMREPGFEANPPTDRARRRPEAAVRAVDGWGHFARSS